MKPFRVVHVNTFDRGGAAISALRLHRDLREAGVDSTMVVAAKTRDEPGVLEVPGWLHRLTWPHFIPLDYRLGRFVCPVRQRYCGLTWLPGLAARFIAQLQPDVVHLHWVSRGILSIEQIGQIAAPVVWTLHDMWPLSPGYAYRNEAGASLPGIDPFLPLLPGEPFHQLGAFIWRRKLRSWRGLRMVVAAPSHWMAEEARRSEVFRGREVREIPYSVPHTIFRPADRGEMRSSLGLPRDRPLLLFGADGGAYRKGIDLLFAALRSFRDAQPPEAALPLLVKFGSGGEEFFRDSPLEIHDCGSVSDPQKVAALFAGCDAFCCPSREDNLPNTVLESLACGTPVVGFRIGGLHDLIDDGVNGFLAAPFDTADLGQRIGRALSAQRATGELGRVARTRIEEQHTPAATSLRYREVYDRLVSDPAYGCGAGPRRATR